MELGAEISQKVKKTIKKQLKTLGCYVDDELPEYIMVMIANKRTQEQMVEDLQLFLNDEAEKFVDWLIVVLGRIKKAMELPDIDAIVGDIEMEPDINKKPKKGKKERNSESEEENAKSDKKHDHTKVDERKKKDVKEKGIEEKEREKRHSHERGGDRHSGADNKAKENEEKKEKDRKQRTDHSSRRDRDRDDENKRRDEEISKRRAAREKRYQEDKRKDEQKKKEKEHGKENDKVDERESKDRKHRDSKRKDDNHGSSGDRRTREDDTKRPSRNPMEFVKQIAQDITDQITLSHPQSLENTNDEKDNSTEINDDDKLLNGSSMKDDDKNADVTQSENVSLQAVSQYNDVEIDAEKGDSESLHKSTKEIVKKKTGSRSPSKSRTRHHNERRSSRSRRSKSPDKNRRDSHSPSRSKDKHNDRSRRESRRSSPRRDRHESKSKQSNKEDSSRRRDEEKSRHGKDERKRESNEKRRSSQSHNHDKDKEVVDKKSESTDDTEEEIQTKPSLSSQVQVFTDFKRKPSLPKHNQASSVLLKRAVTEVVNHKPDGEENDDDVELDYNETNDENEEFSDDCNKEVSDRRVINFNEEKSGLPTITVKFNQDKHEKRHRSKSGERDHYRNGNHDKHSRSRDQPDSIDQNISKYDARYTILRSRLEPANNERKVHHRKHRNEKSSNDKSLSSMVADLEEKTRRVGGERGSLRDRDRRNSRDSHGRHKDRNQDSHRRHDHAGEEEGKHHFSSVKERRIEMHESEGDLRDLLSGKRVQPNQQKSSSDEDASSQHLREKIKAEKHKMLFGKLKPEERDRSKREREHLAEQLKAKNRKRKMTETNESPEWIEKVADFKDYVENVTEDESEVEEEKVDEWEVLNEAFEPYDEELKNGENVIDDTFEPYNDDEINNEDVNDEENDSSTNHLSQNDLEAVSDEELVDEFEKEVEEEQKDDENIDFETSRDSNEEGHEKGNDDDDEEEIEEVVEIEVEVSDSENLDGENQSSQTRDVMDSQNGQKYPTEYVDLVKDDNVSPAAIKDSMHVESSDEVNDEVREIPVDSASSDKYERKSKSKSSKRKRMRHEFIVTLEGLGDGKKLSIEAGGREKSPKLRRLPERKSDRTRRHRHMRRSQSDEEFEEILRRKEEEEKRFIEQNKFNESRKSHRSRSHSSEKESRHRESRVNREIMLAESKLKTQKVFKKCLETVQNVTNTFNVGNTAAFINPNFPHKLPIRTLNPAVALLPGYNEGTIKVLRPVTTQPICTLAVGEKIILQSTVLTPNRDTIAVKPLRIERSKDYVIPTSALDIVTLPHVNSSTTDDSVEKSIIVEDCDNLSIVEPVAKKEILVDTVTTVENVTEVNNVQQVTPSVITVSDEINAASTVPAKASIQERCAFWPNCKNQACPYIHPSVNCKLFPNCSYGQHCIYIHPPCMFGEACSNATCPFMHVQASPPAFTGYAQICKFYPNCVKSDCPYKHVTKACRYGASCNNPECSFSHDDVHSSLSASSLKWIAEKPHVSERKFAAVEAIVTHIPVPIVTSTT